MEGKILATLIFLASVFVANVAADDGDFIATISPVSPITRPIYHTNFVINQTHNEHSAIAIKASQNVPYGLRGQE